MRGEVFGSGTAHVGFRLDLEVVGGRLGAVVSNAEIGGEPIPADIVEIWNERLAFQLERAGRQNPDSTLASVTIAGDQLQMEWRVETAQSRN